MARTNRPCPRWLAPGLVGRSAPVRRRLLGGWALATLATLFPGAAPPGPEPTRIACLSDRITEGSGYLDALQTMLGKAFVARNFGVGGSTLLATGDKPYRAEAKYHEPKEFRPTSCSYAGHERHEAPGLPVHRRVRRRPAGAVRGPRGAGPEAGDLRKPVPVYGRGNHGIDNARLVEGILPAIEAVTPEKELHVIDLHSAHRCGHWDTACEACHPCGVLLSRGADRKPQLTRSTKIC